MILGQVKQDSEEPLGGNLTDPVITASVAFNEAQRLATKQTRMIAGIDVRAIIKEPTVAALVWSSSNSREALGDKQK